MAAPKNQHGLTPKQEAFARAFFECGNAVEAYRRSYDVDDNARDPWIRVEACQLLDNPNVTLRLEALRAEAEKLSIYGVGQALKEYEAARTLAMTEKNPSAAVSAVTGKARLFGLDAPKRIAIGGDKDAPPIKTEDISAREILEARLDAIARRTAGDGPAV
jgi:phage terminase small subunit